ncbi:hypothetical protein BDA96_07G082000 [Sorghum bicolor]|uniref:Uncharacterized protein n=1 Tax=Sorghum bicolor TaxID=4558 RepID=A0A921U9V8_SORBI|nr:uncharacterized protein LOC110437029 isoform X2 [Sorghum bicolor]KAG0522956.1 hypothetical protein BDA96_07G082000 [Sorghum bicolor]|eukprot:XP_021320738.1 uncharacterized protein LOC110437029 isoform X2 [Sorghum bicolor]
MVSVAALRGRAASVRSLFINTVVVVVVVVISAARLTDLCAGARRRGNVAGGAGGSIADQSGGGGGQGYSTTSRDSGGKNLKPFEGKEGKAIFSASKTAQLMDGSACLQRGDLRCGAIIAQCHNVGWQPSQEAAATVEESRVTCIANQAAESLFIAGRSRGTHDPKVKLPRNVSTLFSCTTQPWSRPEGSLLGS